MPTIADVIEALERFAPTRLAASWDNVGLLLGDRGNSVSRVLTCLTLTSEVAQEAVDSQVQLIVTHHPILFRGAKRITTDTAEGRSILALAKAGIAVYSPHTAFDNTVGGINDQLANRLGLTEIQPLRKGPAVESCKLVAFVPESDLAKVSDAIFAAGAGQIGEYRECSFRLAGTGTFIGTDAANPVVGQKGRREEVAEWRLEVVVPRAAVERVAAALRQAHSYEEPAFDVYPLTSLATRGGEGRIGQLSSPQLLGEFASFVRRELNSGPVQIIGDAKKPVKRIALACGAAGEFLTDAQNAKADAFLTGEMRFHDYLNAKAAGMGLVLPGHYATERFALEVLARWLSQNTPGLKASASSVESDPVTWV